jgi:prenyl protein peptidase
MAVQLVLRNLVIAPITEELVFRGCMVPLLLPHLGYGYQLSWITPLFFGVAHLHHMLAGVPIPQVVMQLGYRARFCTQNLALERALFGLYVRLVLG